MPDAAAMYIYNSFVLVLMMVAVVIIFMVANRGIGDCEFPSHNSKCVQNILQVRLQSHNEHRY